MHRQNTLRAWIGLGANLNDARANVDKAARLLISLDGVLAHRLSPVYLSEPQEDANQPFFINQVAELSLRADITPEHLLALMQNIELKLGRVREKKRRYGPRTIDLDLLLFGNTVCNSKYLTLPHPRLTKRAFVLVPLLDVDKNICLPDGRALALFLSNLDYSVCGNCIRQSSRR